jgi:hypothetical protein
MKLSYQLAFEHYVEHQLFVASQSPAVRKKRQYSRFTMAVVYAILGFLMLRFSEDYFLTAVFFVIAVGWFFAYPYYSRQRYRKHYEKHIRDNYQNRVGVPVDMEIDQNTILAKDKSGESKIRTSEIKALVLLPGIFLIQLKNDTSFIIPKSYVADQEMLKQEFENLGVPFEDASTWEWR